MTAASKSKPSFLTLFLRGFQWTFLKSVGGMVVRVVTLIILSRLLTPFDFGVVAVAISAIGCLCLLVELGVGPALIQRRQLTPRHVGSALCVTIGLATLVMVLLQVCADPITAWLGIEQEADVFRFLATMVFLQPLVGILSCLARRNLDMKDVTTSGLAGAVFGYGGVGIGLALAGMGYWALAIAQMAQFAVTFALLVMTQRRRISFQVGLQEARDVLAFGASFSVGRLANYAAQKLDRALIGMLLGVEAAGNYQRVLNILQVIGPFFAGPLDAIMFPLLSRIQNSPEGLRRCYRAATAVTALLTMPASVLICVSAPVIVPLILGSQWTGVIVPAQIMAWVLFFRTNDSITDTLSRAVGRVKERAALQVVYAILSLGSIFVLKDFGLAGITAGLLAVTILNFFAMCFLVRRITITTLADNFAPLIPGVLAGASFAAVTGAFYFLIGDRLFTIGPMALYFAVCAALFVLLVAGLPSPLFPEELATLRATCRQKAMQWFRQWRPAPAQLNPIDR
jgi:O-antigen/teichoic acid export membrane protein